LISFAMTMSLKTGSGMTSLLNVRLRRDIKLSF
jgi:hypothetical protein